MGESLEFEKANRENKKKLGTVVMHLYIFSLIYIFYGYGSVNVDHFVENFILSGYRSFFRKYWLQFDL